MQQTKLNKIIETKEELANLIGVPLSTLELLAKDKWSHIRYSKRKDKKGKERDFFIADKELRSVHVLIDTKILDQLDMPLEIKGGIKGRSRSSNASVHLGASNVAHFDIRNFYPNTKPEKVFRSFLSIGIRAEPAKLLTRLVTVDSLAQGFVTSTKVSAVVLLKLNRRLRGFLKKYGIKHTIWIDDIVLSGEYPLKKLKSGIKKIVEGEDYQIKDEKTSIRYKNEPQVVTGATINNGISASKDKVDKIKKIIYICKNYGVDAYLGVNEPGISVDNLKNKMAGELGNLISVNKDKYKSLQDKWKQVVKVETSLGIKNKK